MSNLYTANQDIRDYMADHCVTQRMLAVRLGISSFSINKMLKTELSHNEKENLIQHIDAIASEAIGKAIEEEPEMEEQTVSEASEANREETNSCGTKFQIGDRVKIPSKQLTIGVVSDIWSSLAKQSIMYAVNTEDGRSCLYAENQLEPAPLPIEYTFNAIIEDNVAVVCMIAHQGEKTWVYARGHAHILHDGAVGEAQAVSYAARRMFESLDTKQDKEALEAYREKAVKTQREMLDRWQESRKKGVEGRNKTAMRHKIQNVVKELNDLLLNESKKRHVPDSLKKAVAAALDLVNMDTVGAEQRAAKYAALIAKETDQDKIDAYTVTMENILRQGEKMGQRLKELHDAYEEIANSDDPDIANAHDPMIAGAIKELSQSIGNTSIKDMSIEQLSDVYDMYKMVLTKVRDANKAMQDNIKENISNLASRVVGEVRVTGGEHKYRAAILDHVRKFDWNNLKPVYAFERIGSATMPSHFRWRTLPSGPCRGYLPDCHLRRTDYQTDPGMAHGN